MIRRVGEAHRDMNTTISAASKHGWGLAARALCGFAIIAAITAEADPQVATQVEVVEGGLALGAARYVVDDQHRVLGWKLSKRWYFGRRDAVGQKRDVGLVWINGQTRVALGDRGLSWSRSF